MDIDVGALDQWIGDRLPGAGDPLTAQRMGEATGIANALFILERGVWWLTPELSAENPMNPFLRMRPKMQPVQYWPRPDHRGGVIDLLSVVKATGILGGLQDFGNSKVVTQSAFRSALNHGPVGHRIGKRNA